MVWLLLFLIIILTVCYTTFPIISGYASKVTCSAVFISDRTEQAIATGELAAFPVNLARSTIDRDSKKVTTTVWGFARKETVFLEATGATLLNGINEEDFRKKMPRQAETAITTASPLAGEPTLNTALANAIDYAFTEVGKSTKRTRAVVVVHNGRIVAERYAEGFSVHSRLPGWSLAKSITNALIGVLVRQGRLNIDAPAPVAEWASDSRRTITITQLMQMSSGLKWWEFYAAPSDVTNMLYNEHAMGAFAATKKLQHEPGTVFQYSSGSTNILSGIIKRALPESEYVEFPYKELFYKLGMRDTIMEVDASGTFVGSSYCYASARDWARFGQLYLNDGIAGSERILPEGWLKYTTTPTAAKMTSKEDSYGALWWLNTERRRYADVPEDCFRCQGHEGQYIWVIPSHDLVVVRLALEKNHSLDGNRFLAGILQALPPAYKLAERQK